MIDRLGSRMKVSLSMELLHLVHCRLVPDWAQSEKWDGQTNSNLHILRRITYSNDINDLVSSYLEVFILSKV